MLVFLQNITNNTCYIAFWIKKIFKIKTDKFYLRLPTSQKKKKKKRLSRLAKLLIEKEMLAKLEYKNLISNLHLRIQEK